MSVGVGSPFGSPESAPGGGRLLRVIAARKVIGTVEVAHHGMEATMATKITVVLEDDLEGGPADETVRFGVGGLSSGARLWY